MRAQIGIRDVTPKMLLDAVDKFADSYNRRTQKHITFEEGRTIIHGNEQDRIYVPSPTGELFAKSDAFVNLVIGPYGSGKTTMCLQRIVRSTCNMPAWSNGRRKARWAAVRNTSGELHSTTFQSWLSWFGDLGDVHKRQKPLLTLEHTFNDGHGVIELELIFIALDRPDDVRKIKSLELTGVYLNELSELPQNVLSHFKGRVNGRYPSRSFCPDPYWSGIIADTNPPDEDHWIFNDFETNPTPNYRVFHQPSGLLEEDGVLVKDKDGNYVQNPRADNHEHLSADYYPKLGEKQSDGFIKVYCCGRYGLVESGKRVYPEYNDDLHSVAKIDAIQGDPIYLGFDFGLQPSCIVIQITPRGQVRVLKEYIGEDIGIKTFAKNIVLPRLAIDFVYNKIGGSQGDPAGAAGDAIMEELSCIGELNALGITTHAATTNDIDVRINSVRYFLNLMIDGQPAFLLDRTNCPILRKGFMSGYHFKRMAISGDERYQDKPNKNKYSHCFVGETLVHTPNGEKRIDELKINDLICTPKGNRKIVATMFSKLADIIELTFSNNKIIRCTPDHPFITTNGIVRADALQYDDVLIGFNQCQEKQNMLFRNLMGSSITANQANIIRPIISNIRKLVICIEMCGNFILGIFQRDIISITSTMTEATMTLKTYQSLLRQNTQLCMDANVKVQKKQESAWKYLGHSQLNGINLKKEENGTQSMGEMLGKIGKKFSMNVSYVINPIRDLSEQIKKGFVRLLVSHEQDDIQELMTKQENVRFVKENLELTNTTKQNPVLRLVERKQVVEQKKVFDLTVEDQHCFYANGILVSNCHDALQYALMPFAADRIIEKTKPKQTVDVYNPVLRIFN